MITFLDYQSVGCDLLYFIFYSYEKYLFCSIKQCKKHQLSFKGVDTDAIILVDSDFIYFNGDIINVVINDKTIVVKLFVNN